MPDNFHSFSKEIARDFLQTVIVVDDRAFFPSNRLSEPVGTLIAPGFETDENLPLDNNYEEFIDEVETDDNKHEDLNAKELIDKFAQHSIVCSIIRPSDHEEANLPETIKNLAKSCDLIIFDWHIGKDYGNLIKGLIREISLESTRKSKRNRLIVVYTGDGGLRDVYNDIKKELADANIIFTEEKGNFTISTESVRIVIFAKPDSLTGRILKKREVTVTQLPETLIAEFTKMTEGLISNAAMKSFSLIRENTFTILSKFRPELDAPFLAHRMMLRHPSDANDLLTSLIGSEITSLLESKQIGSFADWVISDEERHFLKEWINHFSSKNKNWNEQWATLIPNGEVQEEIVSLVLYLLTEPIEAVERLKKLISQENQAQQNQDSEIIQLHKKNLTGKFTSHGTDINRLESEFAGLTTLNSTFKSLPVLRLGTVLKLVKRGNGQEDLNATNYWLCIQPLCDSVRIPADGRKFLLLKLKSIELESEKPFDLIIRDQGNYKPARVVYRQYESQSDVFRPNDNRVVSAHEENNNYFFLTRGNPNEIKKYQWLCELKFAQAQRIVNQYASQLSRVGLDESEWLRRWSGDSND